MNPDVSHKAQRKRLIILYEQKIENAEKSDDHLTR